MVKEIYFNFVLYTEDETEISEDKLDHVIDSFLGCVGDSGFMAAGGAVSSSEVTDLDEDVINEDQICPKCNGAGFLDREEVTEPLSKEDWDELYAPVAQGTEHHFPKVGVEGSNPSGSASNEYIRECRKRNGEDRESSSRENSDCDERGDRERGNNHRQHNCCKNG